MGPNQKETDALQLTKRTDYAIRACMYLASSSSGQLASSSSIALQMTIPEQFLPRVLAELSQAGIVEAQIGRNGGYRLRRSATRISVLELVESLEGPTRTDRCALRQQQCDASDSCAFHPVMNQAQSALIEVLAATTLADLVATDRTARPRPTRYEGTAS